MADDAQSILAEMDSGAEEPVELEEQDIEEAPEGEDQEQPEGEAEAKADDEKAKEPLPPEELEKRYRDQQGATFAERQRRRELESKVERMEQTFQQIQQRMVQPQQPQAQQQPIDPKEDPIAFLEQLQRQQQEQAQMAQQRQAHEQQQQARIEAVHRLGRDVADVEQDFVRSAPDYYEAIDHMINTRGSQLAAFGMRDPAEIQATIKAEVAQLTSTALQNGANPAEAAYNMAKQMGYQRAQPQAAQRLDMARNGQRASKTMSGGGRSAGGQMTLGDIANLEGKEFDAACDRLFAGEY